MWTRTFIRTLLVLLALLVGVSGCATIEANSDERELCEFKERVATPFNMKRVVLEKSLANGLPKQTGILLCALKESSDIAVTSEVLRREDVRVLVIWVNDALLALPAKQFLRYAIGRELLRFPDESGVCDHQHLPEYIPCELLLDIAVAKRYSSKQETVATLRSVVTALDAAGKKELLKQIIEFRLNLFERSMGGTPSHDEDANDDTSLAAK